MRRLRAMLDALRESVLPEYVARPPMRPRRGVPIARGSVVRLLSHSAAVTCLQSSQRLP